MDTKIQNSLDYPFLIIFEKFYTMRKTFLSMVFMAFLTPSLGISQQVKNSSQKTQLAFEKPYNETADGDAEISNLIKKAKKQNKLILIQAGGNWCIWCLRFNHFVKNTPELEKIISDNYLYYHLNFSPKNKNEKAFQKYAKEGHKLGYPFFVVLDTNGKVLGIDESSQLEQDKGYSLVKVEKYLKSYLPQ